MNLVLFLNDWRLAIWQAGEEIYRQPAVALESHGAMVFGQDALQQARIHPRQTNTQYLSRLNADPLTTPLRSARNHADLLYLQLKSVLDSLPELSRATWNVVVPSTTTPQQLGLLLGIAKEAGITINDFYDLATSGVAALPPESNDAQYLEIFQHEAQLAVVSCQGEVVRSSAQEFSDVGLTTLADGWANVIADQFVQTTRFDPLHAATTEQQLYNRILSWFDGRFEPVAEIEHNDEQRRLEVNRQDLERKLAERLAPIESTLDPQQPVYLGGNAASTPFLESHLLAGGFDVVSPSHEFMVEHLDYVLDNMPVHDDTRLVVSLPRARRAATFARPDSVAELPAAEPDPMPSAAPAPTNPASDGIAHLPGAATHGLHGAMAYPIGSDELPAEAAQGLSVGTSLTVAGRLFILIEVKD